MPAGKYIEGLRKTTIYGIAEASDASPTAVCMRKERASD